MKKIKIALILSFLIIISIGCANADKNETTSTHNSQVQNNETNEVESSNSQNENAENESTHQPDKEKQTEEETDKPTYEVNENWYVVPKEGEDDPEDVVLLTIDDAPDEHAIEMAEKLKEMNVPAIFFVNGHFLETEEEKEMLKKIDELGFPIGNHTMTHPDLTTLSEDQQKEEILEVNKMVEDILGKKPKFFRAPYGQNTEYTKELAKEEDMLLMNWVYGYDWNEEYQNADALSDIMLNTKLLNNGAILLMHDREWTNNALEDIVTGLQDKGYTMLDPMKIETEEDKNNAK